MYKLPDHAQRAIQGQLNKLDAMSDKVEGWLERGTVPTERQLETLRDQISRAWSGIYKAMQLAR